MIKQLIFTDKTIIKPLLIIVLLTFFIYQNIFLALIIGGIFFGTDKNYSRKSGNTLFIFTYFFLLIDDFFLKDGVKYPRNPYMNFVIVSIVFNAILALIPILVALILNRIKQFKKT